MNCERVIRDEVAEQYLRGELTESDRETFELHYFQCARCFDELETYRALRHGLEETGGETPLGTAPASGMWSPRTWAAAAAGVVLAIALGSWLLRTTPAPSPATAMLPPEVTAPPSGPGAPPAVGNVAPRVEVGALSELARVVPPRYTPSVLRGASDDEARRFREGMQRYLEGDYAGATDGLKAAAERNANAPDVAFFLGICFLLTDDAGAAVEQLGRTIALGDSPFLEEAHFYLAKAHLRRGDVDAAASELAKTVALRGDREKEAGDLLQNVDVLRTRRLK